jgi:gliding motility-associated-like protein
MYVLLKAIKHNNAVAMICLMTLCLALPASAQYDFTANRITGNAPLRVKFHFVSTATVDSITSYNWDFGNGQTSALESPDSVTYADTGTYSPSLVLNNRIDMKILKSNLIRVLPPLSVLDVPNVFTPNDDSFNDDFQVINHSSKPVKMRIFTRAGILVYEEENIQPKWDGRIASGSKLSNGIYYYTIEATGDDPGKQYSRSGFFYLYR